MPKRTIPKKKTTTKTKVVRKKTPKNPKNVNIEKVLIENFISLQKVMTNLAVKFDNLGAQISKLLELFEISAKTLAEKDIKFDKGKVERKEEGKMVEKLDTLLDQNKIMARGLTLLHETPKETPMPRLVQKPIPQPMPPQRPPRMVPQPFPIKQGVNIGEYQKSIPIKSKESSSPKSVKSIKNEKVF